MKFLRRRIPHHSLLRRLWRQVHRRWAERRPAPEQIFLKEFADILPQAYFIQIGSNDGVQLDPLRTQLRSSQWRGVMIEPVPHIFRKLCENCREYASRVTFMNVAIASKDSTLPFYYLRPASSEERNQLPEFYDMLGSFNKEVVLSHAPYIPRIEERIICANVDALSFDSLCKHLGVSQIDLVHIDAEGYDFEILKNIDLSTYRPIVLIYEHHHLNAYDRAACEHRLKGYGYDIISYGMDSWCFREDVVSANNTQPLINAWRSYRRSVHRK